MQRFIAIALLAAAALVPGAASAAYVVPQLGGGDPGGGSYPMKHADISFDGVNLSVAIDPEVAIPVLRPLTPPNEFNPAMPYAVLQDKAYNMQYGWNPSGFWAPPSGTAVWVEYLSGSPELEVYFVDGWPSYTPYAPIFGTDGSPPIWKWEGYMIHNAYAVLNPTQSSYEATYRVYIGDEGEGTPVPGYGAAVTTFIFEATPVYAADFDGDGSVDDQDLLQWQGDFGANGDSDADTDGDSDLADLLVWQREFSGAGGPSLAAVPEPSCIGLVALATGLASGLRRKRQRCFSKKPDSECQCSGLQMR